MDSSREAVLLEFNAFGRFLPGEFGRERARARESPGESGRAREGSREAGRGRESAREFGSQVEPSGKRACRRREKIGPVKRKSQAGPHIAPITMAADVSPPGRVARGFHVFFVPLLIGVAVS